jgi:hypothetical protein
MPPPQGRAARFFYMHVGSFVALLVYGVCLARAGRSAGGVQRGLLVALVVETVYVALAARRGEIKYADYCLWTLFALATLLVWAGVGPAMVLFQSYSTAVFFGTFALMALVPLLLGRETFTYYYARRQVPRWQQNLPSFHALNQLITAFWALIFVAAAGLAASAPHDWRFTALYPNLLVFVVGVPAPLWLTPLYLWWFPPALPQEIEPLIMGMPYAFDARAAKDGDATIQFCVSGARPANYYLRIARGKCQSFEGRASAADLTVHTPDSVWLQIAHGQLDRVRALEGGLYRVEGNLAVLAQMSSWFPPNGARPTQASSVLEAQPIRGSGSSGATS